MIIISNYLWHTQLLYAMICFIISLVVVEWVSVPMSLKKSSWKKWNESAHHCIRRIRKDNILTHLPGIRPVQKVCAMNLQHFASFCAELLDILFRYFIIHNFTFW